MKGRITFSDEQRSEIIRRYIGGEWVQSIAPDFSCSVGTISKNLKEWGIEVKKRVPMRPFEPLQVERILELYKEGVGLEEIGTEVGCSRASIARVVRESGGVIRRRGKPQKCFDFGGQKQCSTCRELKPKIAYALHSTTHDGLQPRCRTCSATTTQEGRLKRKFGMTPADYDTMLAGQTGLCAICGNPETRMKFGKPTQLAVDHCHTTGKVRGLLCSKCNCFLGLAKDDTAYLDKAKAYLETHA